MSKSYYKILKLKKFKGYRVSVKKKKNSNQDQFFLQRKKNSNQESAFYNKFAQAKLTDKDECHLYGLSSSWMTEWNLFNISKINLI